MTHPKVLRTKITPPRRSERILVRPRVQNALIEALHYRLIILQAGTGYGKSTALAALAEAQQPFVWYQVTDDDADALVFLLHLCHAFQATFPELAGLPIAYLETWDGQRGPLPAASALDQLINALTVGLDQPTLLALDDAHLAASDPEIALLLDRLISLAPDQLHILLAARPPLKLPNLPRWRAAGQVLTIDQGTLAFNAEEIAALFGRHYGYELTPEEAENMYANTEGWAVALQLFWQSLRGAAHGSVETALSRQASSLDSLFEILAGEVFGHLPEDVRDFLMISATLRELEAEDCDILRGANDSSTYLGYLRRQELFVVETGGRGEGHHRLRYHHIFHDFLRQRVPERQRRTWHGLAAQHYQSRGELDEAIYHYLQAGDHASAATLLDDYGTLLINSGRLDTLSKYLDSVPPPVLQQHPALLYNLGDLARLHSRFQEALGWYQQAEGCWRERGESTGVARALRGQARVYLDTVNPSLAEKLLEKSIRLTDGIESREAQARLYELLAENKLNAGRIEEAEGLREKAEALRAEGPTDSQLLLRVLLRTGRLDEARQRLEAQADSERKTPVYTPRAHRETLLLLSLVYSFQGLAEEAYRTAREGTQRGEELDSPFITAVGYMRQGHALMLYPDQARYAEARQSFLRAKEISRELAVPRLLVETYWGLCRAYGYQGDLPQARQVAEEGIAIAEQAGDEWVASLTRLAMGASLVLNTLHGWQGELASGEAWLERAAQGFLECSDPFAHSLAQLWLCLHWWLQRGRREHSTSQLEHTLQEALATCRANNYDYLLTRPTLLGPPDERMLVPLLILARDQGWESGYAARLLTALNLDNIAHHPGYRLRIHTLGGFQVWRGGQPISNSGWRREKARQILQILITHRSAPLDRDQIIEYLWPDLEPAAAQRNFKVALNSLYQVLEPERDPGSESAYIRRTGTAYELRPYADLWLDVDEFNRLLEMAEQLPKQAASQLSDILERALDIYQGEYLPEARYDTWSAAEREHLAVQFLQAADRLSELYLQAGRCEETVQLCQRILNQDNCWERAYRHMMAAFAAMGDRGQVARTYKRCVAVLRSELEVSPAPETEALYTQLTRSAN